MAGIGGLTQYLYGGSNYGSGGLAQYLGNASSGGGTPSLASILSSSGGGSASSSSSSSSSDAASSGYQFPTDSQGQPVVATLSDISLATKPSDKLTIAGQVAEAIRMQSDCSVRGGSANRLSDMTSQTQSLLAAVNSVVGALATTNGSVAAGKADPAITPYQSTLSTVLGRVASVVANLQVLTSKASATVAAQTKASLASLSSEASGIATKAGLNWPAMTKTATKALTTGTASVSAPRLIDYRA